MRPSGSHGVRESPLVPSPDSVPFVDLSYTHRSIRDEVLAEIGALIDSGSFSVGPAVAEFESAFASYCRASFCVGTSNGLDAIRLALLAAGIQEKDEVIVPANTFVATFAAVHQARGIPVPVDVTEADYNIDVAAAEAAITERTRFVVPVHLYGQMADMRALRELADRNGLTIVEDACQAHGAERDGVRPGELGAAAAFSFYPSKNLGAMGDAGAVVTDDGHLADRIRTLREHGQTAKYRYSFEGYTARLDTIQAIVLLRKLPYLDAWNDDRRAAARFYSDQLAEVGDLRLPPVPPGSNPVWHVYTVRTADADRLAEHLASRGIATGRHYPEPAHLSPAFAWLGYGRGDFPVTEVLARELLSLPLYPGITEQQLRVVVQAVREYFSDA